MAALDLGQWSAVGAIVASHSPSPTLVAAVDRELAAAREAERRQQASTKEGEDRG